MSVKKKLNNLYDYLVSSSLYKEADNVFKISNAAYTTPPEILERIEREKVELEQKKTNAASSVIDAIMEHSPSMFDTRPEYMASGTEATVFKSGEKVLKITKSAGEAGIASAVKNSPYWGIYNVYEVYKVGPMWALVVELLQSQNSEMYEAGTIAWGAVDSKRGATSRSRNFIFNNELKFVDVLDMATQLIKDAGGLEFENSWTSRPSSLSALSDEEASALSMVIGANSHMSPSKDRLRGTEKKTKKGYSGGRQVDVDYLEMGYFDYLDALKTTPQTMHLQDLKDHLKYISDNFGVRLSDISGGNYGSRDGKVVLLDLGYSSGVSAQDYVDLSNNI